MSDKEFYCLSPPREAKPSVEEGLLYGTIDWYEKYRSVEFVQNSVHYETIDCPLMPQEHKRAGTRTGQLQLILSNSQIPDFIWTVTSECVVTNRVLQLFRKAGFTGFQELEAPIVKIRGRRRDSSEPIPRVWELKIVGKGGHAHPDSGIRLLYACSGCGLKTYSSFRNGIRVDDTQWDGSDFFTVNGYSGFILVTEKVKDLIIQNRLKNCAIIRSRSLKWGEFPRPEDFVQRPIPRDVR